MTQLRKPNQAFYGDSGTMLPEQARDEIEENAGAGHPGNNVDFSQRYAQSEADAAQEEEEFSKLPNARFTGKYRNDSAKFWRFMAHLDRRENGETEPPKPQEPAEEPTLSRAADDKFWSDPEAVKRAGKMVRPGKL